jgi:hypothetical protein
MLTNVEKALEAEIEDHSQYQIFARTKSIAVTYET